MMPREWIKPGARAMVEVVQVEHNGAWVACTATDDRAGADFMVRASVLQPMPPAMTPEQADVIAAARAFRRAFIPGFGYSEPATVFMRAVDRLTAAEAAPDPVGNLRAAAHKAVFTLRQSGNIVTAEMLADAISSSEVCP